MIGLVINKMSFDGKDGKIYGVNLTLKSENGFYLPKVDDKKHPGAKILKFYSLPAEVFKNVSVGYVYDFTFSVNVDTGATFIDDAELSSF